MNILTYQDKIDPKILSARENLYRLFNDRPMKEEELLINLGLYIRSGALAKILFLNELYEKIVNIPGVCLNKKLGVARVYVGTNFLN